MAQRAEAAGLDEVWVVEDCFWGGGVSTAMLVLDRTHTVTVGIGILPAVARNAAFTAMELATLSNAHPGRVIAGLGHGMPAWMEQVGARPRSALAALEETLVAVRRLLRGERMSVEGQHVRLVDVQLEQPPAIPPLVLAGVRGPRSLELAGRAADGTILAEPVSIEYLSRARSLIDIGRTQVGVANRHHVVAYNFFAANQDGNAARASVRQAVASVIGPTVAAQVGGLPFAEELIQRAGEPHGSRHVSWLSDPWLSQLAVAGTTAECAERLRSLRSAGADSCVMIPPPGVDPLAAVDQLVGVSELFDFRRD
jgi:alkanesulfonate monooxygenase SsuD/methylene tetrahydromethanopterin reductase-like flavin-dependent oxidoreductase (luciferase family)